MVCVFSLGNCVVKEGLVKYKLEKPLAVINECLYFAPARKIYCDVRSENLMNHTSNE